MAEHGGNLILTLEPGTDVDAGELARLSRQLRGELLQTDVESVEVAAAGEPPPGAKGADAPAWGTLVVSVLFSEAIRQVVAVVHGWLGRRDQGSVTLSIGGDSITVTRTTGEEKRRLIDEWIAAHGSG